MSYSVQIPDFAGTLQRQEAMNQQAQLSRLQMLAQTQAMRDADQFRSVAGEILPQLGTAQGESRLTLLAKLAGGGGMQGAQMALPMIQQERDKQEGQRLIAGLFGGAAPAAGGAMPGAAAVPAPAIPAPSGGAPAPAGGDVRALNAEAASRRQAIMDNPNLTAQQRDAALAEVSAWRASAGGTPSIPNGYRGDQPWAAGLPAPAGTVRPVSTGQGATPAPAAAPAAPAGAPGTAGLPTPQQLVTLMMSGNQTAMAFAQRVAPLVARENPNWTSVTADGNVYMINPQNPAQRVVIGRASDPASREAAPFGSGAGGASLAFIEQLAPRVASGNASPEEVRRYLSAVTEYQQEKVSQDGTRIVPRLPAYAPGADVVVQQYGIGGAQPAPAQPAAQPAPQQQAGVGIPGTGMRAEPPALQASPLPGAAGGVARTPQPAPQQAVTGMLANANSLRQAREALQMATDRPESFGLVAGAQNMVPGLLERTDPEGVNARAVVANLGSLVLHDRSGAAVTAAEFPRLRPFIPQVGDPPNVVQDKVRRFVQEYEAVLRDQYQTFGPDAGFRPQAAVEDALRGGAARPGQTREAPAVGAVQQGYRFRGGDPSKRENWERVAQ